MVEHGDQERRELFQSSGLRVQCPHLHLFDWRGTVPLNLARTEFLLERFAEKDRLLEDVLRDCLAFLLVRTPSSKREVSWQDLEYPFAQACISQINFQFALATCILAQPWVVLPHGLALLDAEPLEELGVKSVGILPHIPESAEAIADYPGAVIYIREMTSFEQLSHLLQPREGFEVEPVGLKVVGSRILLNARFNQNQLAGSTALWKDARPEWSENDLHCYAKREPSAEPELPLRRLASDTDHANVHEAFRAVEWTLGKRDRRFPMLLEAPLRRVWREYLGGPLLPFDPVERRTQCARIQTSCAVHRSLGNHFVRQRDFRSRLRLAAMSVKREQLLSLKIDWYLVGLYVVGCVANGVQAGDV
jgi:hypothetical protein